MGENAFSFSGQRIFWTWALSFDKWERMAFLLPLALKILTVFHLLFQICPPMAAFLKLGSTWPPMINSDITRMCVLQDIASRSGNGTNGKPISTGWRLMGSIFHWPSWVKRQFGSGSTNRLETGDKCTSILLEHQFNTDEVDKEKKTKKKSLLLAFACFQGRRL